MNSPWIGALRSVALNVPDLAQAESFYTGTWHLAVAARTADTLYLSGGGRDHHLLALHRGDGPPTIRQVTLRARSAEALAAIERGAVAAGGRVLAPTGPATDPAGGRRVVIADPDGRVFEVVHGDEPATDTAGASSAEASGASAGSANPSRASAGSAEPDGASAGAPTGGGAPAPVAGRIPARLDRDRPERLAHVIFNSHDVAATQAFLEQALGFTLADRTANMAFMNCCADHHSVGVHVADNDALNHLAFLMPSLDAVMRGGGRMKDAGHAIEWGPGRHGPGNNAFNYFIDPFGIVIEYTAEVEQVDASYRPGTPEQWKWPAGRVDQWGVSQAPTPRLRQAQRQVFFAPPMAERPAAAPTTAFTAAFTTAPTTAATTASATAPTTAPTAPAAPATQAP